MIRLRSVKLRLTLFYAGLLIIFLSIFGIVTYSELSRALYRDMDRSLGLEAREIENSLLRYARRMLDRQSLAVQSAKDPYSITPESLTTIRAIAFDWEKERQAVAASTVMVRILTPDGKAVVANLTGWQTRILFPDFERDSAFMETGKSYTTIHYQRRPIRLFYHRVSYRNTPLVIVQTAKSLEDAEGALQRLALILLFCIPVAVAFAGFLGWLFVKRAFKPIDLMIREARQITAAYLKGRLPRSHAGDEVDRLAETLNEMMDRIESSTRAVQDFSSDISHELRTPLAIIRGEIDLALRRNRSPEDMQQTLRVIEGEVHELIRLVDDLMLLVRSDAKQIRYEKKPVSLKALLQTVAQRFQDRAGGKQIEISLDLEEDLTVEGDEVYLKRLFSNLLDNAIKFTAHQGKVQVRLGRDDSRACVEVLDNGVGIEVEMHEKVFARFTRTVQARSHEGAGLGLNIAKAICEGHGGSIQIHSEPGEGTRVVVYLPSAGTERHSCSS